MQMCKVFITLTITSLPSPDTDAAKAIIELLKQEDLNRKRVHM